VIATGSERRVLRAGLMTFLIAFGLPLRAAADPPPAREIRISLVVHPQVAAQSAWRGVIKEAVTGALGDWDGIGLRFRVDGESIRDPGPTADLAALVEAMAALPDTLEGAPGRIVLVLVPGTGAADDDLLGYAMLARPYLAIRFADAEHMKLTIRHEMGHVFGLPHLPGRNLMAESFEARSWDFTEVSQDVIRATARMDFSAPVPFSGCDLDVLRDAYAAWAERGVGEAVLLRKLAEAFHAAERPVDAARCETLAEKLSR